NEALLRIINFPARGLGDVTIARISDYAREMSITVLETLVKIAHGEVVIKGVAQNRIASFIQIIDTLQKSVITKDAYESMYEIAYSTGIVNLYKENKSVENQSALQNIEELLNSLKQISDQKATDHEEPLSLGDWLESVVLITTDNEEEKSDDKVTLMTIHSAKGLEFDRVFIVGMEEGLFPMEGTTTSLSDIEEERRLFYVAITRAVNHLTLSLCQNRYRWGKSVNSTPSRFLKEIDEKYLDIDDCEDEYSNVIARAFSSDEDHDAPKKFERKPYNNNTYTNRNNTYTNRPATQKVAPAPQQGEPIVDMSKFKRVTAKPINSASDVASIVVGSNVEHGLFGIGKVTSFERTSTDTKATIEFSKVGTKTLLLNYAKLKTI
ncbi:MAG: 3'-5' exonuclease, partial [Rikenellaceae bacterium]